MSADDGCAECPLSDRRRFLRDAALAVTGALIALGAAPGRAAALPIRFGAALRRLGTTRAYAIPAADGAMIDKDAQVILARYQGKVYGFALSCPHQNTALRWLPEEGRFQCPKHKSRYQPDGIYISGRATRSMDRHAIRRDGAEVVVDLDLIYREDKEQPEWAAAFVALG